MDPTALLMGALGLGLGAVVFYLVGFFVSRNVGEKSLASAQRTSQRLLEEAQRDAETHKRQVLLEAKEQAYQAKQQHERDMGRQNAEITAREKRLDERENNLLRRLDVVEKKERTLRTTEKELGTRESALTTRQGELDRLVQEQNVRLERIASFTAEEAKQQLIANMESEARHEAARRVVEIREGAQREAQKEARKIVTLAIQRSAAEHATESTVSVVNLPGDEMKGRIIGREGRNIRAFERATGIDVIIDDTPEAVVISGFDPIRREVARRSLEQLIADGRIHPGRIEEVVDKTRRQMDEEIVETGERAVLDLGIAGVHPEMIRLLGRLRFRTSYGQNILEHSKEVAYLCEIMASELGYDNSLAKRAGLFHDIGKAVDHEVEGSHPVIGRGLAEKFGEPGPVVEAIAFHHEDFNPQYLMAALVQAADAISGARPGARRESLETYVKRLEKLELIADSFAGVEKSYAIQAGREIRIMVEHRHVDDARAQLLAGEIARKVERELEYPGQIKVVVIRETRAVEYAK
ncbi:MAG TPA: ribonuclease Y [Candidatus Saccharimonadales bacterium]|nr:ribonuclease Y [Candidatus Saccharimonadales bacterium]